MRAPFFASAMTLFLSLTSFAQNAAGPAPLPAAPEPVVHRDWLSGEGEDSLLQKTSCWASTQVVEGEIPARLHLNFPKDRSSLPWVTLQIWKGPEAADQVRVRLSSQRSNALFLYEKATGAETPATYLYAPIELPALLSLVANANSLQIQDGERVFQISLKGSSAALQAVRKCLKSDGLVPTAFLKALNEKTKLVLESPAATAKDLLKVVESAYQASLVTAMKQTELAALQKTMKPVVAKEAAAQKTYDQAQKSWQQTADQLAKAQADEKTWTELLKTTTEALAKKEAGLPLAQEDLKRKKAAYEPLRKEMDSYFKDVAAKEKDLQKTKNEIKRLKSRIPALEREIAALRREKSSLDAEISGLEPRVSTAKREYDERDSDVRRFDANSELRNRLFRDFSYSRKKDEARDKEREASRVENDLRRSQSRERDLERAVSDCKKDPAKNCSSEESALNSQRGESRELGRRRDSLKRESESAEREAERIEARIRSDVEDELDELEDKRNEAESVWRRLASALSSAESRRYDIQTTIPQLQGELASARANLPKYEALQPQQEQALADSIAKRDARSREIGYGAAEAQLKAATEKVGELEKGIAADKKTIKKAQADLKKVGPVIAQHQKTLEKKAVSRDQALQKLLPLRESLKPSRDLESGLKSDLAELAQTFAEKTALYQNIYGRLLEGRP